MSDGSNASDTNLLNDDTNLLNGDTNRQHVGTNIVSNGREHKRTFALVDGLLFYGLNISSDKIEANIRSIKDFDLRDGDVILCGFPRSGNHWVFEIVHMILDDHHSYTEKVLGDFMFEVMWDHAVKTQDGPRVFASHLRPSFLPKAVLEKKVKVVYVFRNPKDTLVSFFRMVSSYREVRYQGSWDEFFELQLTGEYFHGSWFDHLNIWDAFVKENPRAEVFFCQFEKLRENPRVVIAELCRFLGKPEVLAENIADATSFDKMKVGTKEKQKIENEEWTSKDVSVAMVTGRVGTWRSKFTVAQNERFNAFFAQTFKGNVFVDKVKPYI